MININEKHYPNLSEAVAFRITFDPFVYTYDSDILEESFPTQCSRCGYAPQVRDLVAPKSNCKKDYGILWTYEFGVSPNLRANLIENFDITEKDFRPIWNKSGEIVYYQITPQHVMLPLISVNRWRALKPCRKCGRIEYREKSYYNKNDEQYRYITREALEDMTDINVSYEHFDMDMPIFVVSRRVYDYLVAIYPRMRFEPFFLKEAPGN